MVTVVRFRVDNIFFIKRIGASYLDDHRPMGLQPLKQVILRNAGAYSF